MSGRPAQTTRRQREAERRRERQRRQWLVGGIAAAIVGVILVVVLASGSSKAKTAVASSSGPLLASPASGPQGQPVDGMTCGAETLIFHIHAHLGVFVDGQPKTVPAGIGITGSCLYWLHSHTADGIIHMESPVQRTFTLGNYFDVWGQPLSPTQVGPATGAVIAYVDGQRYSGNPRDIALGNHTNVQLDVGTDVAPQTFTFPAGL